jgi:hypothetical protein
VIVLILGSLISNVDLAICPERGREGPDDPEAAGLGQKWAQKAVQKALESLGMSFPVDGREEVLGRPGATEEDVKLGNLA